MRRTAALALLVACLIPLHAAQGTATNRDAFLSDAVRSIHKELKSTVWYPRVTDRSTCTPRRTMDCSCYVRYLVEAVWEFELPRSTHDQEPLLRTWAKAGRATVLYDGGETVGTLHSLDGLDLQPGDLVYSQKLDGGDEPPRHVMIYAGDGEWSHSSLAHRGLAFDPGTFLRGANYGITLVVRINAPPPGLSSGKAVTIEIPHTELMTATTREEHNDKIGRLFETFKVAARAGDAETLSGLMHEEGVFVTELDHVDYGFSSSRGQTARWLLGMLDSPKRSASFRQCQGRKGAVRSAFLSDFEICWAFQASADETIELWFEGTAEIAPDEDTARIVGLQRIVDPGARR